jgi:hypothetical protein
MAALSSRVMTHSVIASTVAKRWVWPFRQPSPKKATTRSAVSLVRIEDCILVRATTDFQAVSWERYAGGVFNIPLCLENPKIGRAYDAEVVSDRIAEDRPVFRYLLAQEM